MRFATVVILASAAIAAAQTTTASNGAYTCEAQNILDACTSQFDTAIKGCEGNDYICLCEGYTNKATCYNNCPDSPEKPPVENQKLQFCNAAAPLISASKASRASYEATAGTKTTQAAVTQTGESSQAGTTVIDKSGSATGSAAGAENTGAAGTIVVPFAGAVAAGLLALL